MERTKVFISYSREDRKPVERLKVFLRQLEREKKIDLWDDSKIDSGDTWRKKIAEAIKACKVAVLFVSADFLASDFIAEDELPPLLKAANDEGVVILSIIVGPVDWYETNLAGYQAVNDPEKPLIDLPKNKKERVFLAASQRIKAIFKELSESKSYVDLTEKSFISGKSVEQRGILSNEPLIFGVPIPAPPAEPRFLAEFVTDAAGNVETYDTHHTNYKIRLFIKNAPPDTTKVVYELHETYIHPVREITKGKEFEEYIASYGDYIVNIDIVGNTIFEVNEWLSAALQNFYGANASPEISKAIKEIKKY